MKIIRKSLILFYDKSGNILIQDRRSYKPGKSFGLFGGSIEKGEDPEDTIIREVKEELSINLKDFKLFKKLVVLNQEEDLIFWIFTANMPKIEDIVCKEGKPYLTDYKFVSSIDLSERDKSIISEIINS
jgi:8-oxo-dGTP pyrophosphatase MutT (NUDIX family)